MTRPPCGGSPAARGSTRPWSTTTSIGASLLGVFSFVVMYVVTSVATLRERTSGTMERLLSTPPGKGDLLVGYAVAFGGLAVVQALVATAFARFQAVQFMPAFVLPQFLLCGLIVPREQMPQVLEHAAALLPLTYAVEAMTEVTRHEALSGALRTDLVALIAFAAGALVLGALTLRRRTP